MSCAGGRDEVDAGLADAAPTQDEGVVDTVSADGATDARPRGSWTEPEGLAAGAAAAVYIQFDPRSAELTREGMGAAILLAEILRSEPRLELVELQGLAQDVRDPVAANELARQRLASVEQFLPHLGVAQSRVRVRILGNLCGTSRVDEHGRSDDHGALVRVVPITLGGADLPSEAGLSLFSGCSPEAHDVAPRPNAFPPRYPPQRNLTYLDRPRAAAVQCGDGPLGPEEGVALPPVYFEERDADFSDQTYRDLAAIACSLRRHPEITLIELQGLVPDARVPAETRELSQARMEHVAAFLAAAHVTTPMRLRAVGSRCLAAGAGVPPDPMRDREMNRLVRVYVITVGSQATQRDVFEGCSRSARREPTYAPPP
jgi:outer membrane protein OmpA-like peptidoglycan-associated protein